MRNMFSSPNLEENGLPKPATWVLLGFPHAKHAITGRFESDASGLGSSNLGLWEMASGFHTDL